MELITLCIVRFFDCNRFQHILVSRNVLFQKFNFLVLSAFGVLHNCAKVDENKPMYRKLNILQVLLPYTLPNNDHPVIMRALMTMSYIVEGDTQHLVQANEASVEFILTTLKAAVNNTSTHQADGFHAYEIVIGKCLTRIRRNLEFHIFLQFP